MAALALVQDDLIVLLAVLEVQAKRMRPRDFDEPSLSRTQAGAAGQKDAVHVLLAGVGPARRVFGQELVLTPSSSSSSSSGGNETKQRRRRRRPRPCGGDG
eukprot:GHVT01049660.1.p3 GENE.GHVT01049660.1~~GHVT01049660.1.p3  ORF type:complete len:101 (-),score=28.27 GHVT01049660.1:478-780(-)